VGGKAIEARQTQEKSQGSHEATEQEKLARLGQFLVPEFLQGFKAEGEALQFRLGCGL
jgi:hypothetical protein